MSERTNIAWATSTWNPWIGCTRVGPGCDGCYAAVSRPARVFKVAWGPGQPRHRTAMSNWKEPLAWNRKAAKTGQPWRVFCSSLADVFDNQAPAGARSDLFRLIEATPELDWLLLTKRPENIGKMIDAGGWFKGFPPNVWLGTTCEDQAAYDRRWPILAQFNLRVRFISYEPAIGPLTIIHHKEKPDWIICGGESGKGFRDMPPIWAEDIMEECDEHFIPFFMKQMAGLKPIPEDLMIRQFPRSLAVPRPPSNSEAK